MRADEQTYRDVAKNCSAYEVKDCCSCSNKSGNVNVRSNRGKPQSLGIFMPFCRDFLLIGSPGSFFYRYILKNSN